MIKHTRLAGLFLLVGCALGIFGCSTSDLPASASFANVTITGFSAAEINKATMAVFKENGYEDPLVGPKDMTFYKEGSRSDTLAYDGLRAVQQGESSQKRVDTELVKLGEKNYRLQCQAYIMSNLSGSRERENKIPRRKNGPYQDMLDDVAAQMR